MAQRMDIPAGYVYAGDDLTINWTIYDGNSDDPKDITGYTLTMVISATQAGAALLTRTPTVVLGPSGTCTTTLTAAHTGTTLGPGTFYAYLKRTDSGSNTTLWWGTIVITDLVA